MARPDVIAVVCKRDLVYWVHWSVFERWAYADAGKKLDHGVGQGLDYAVLFGEEGSEF
jgi:hypothetical protein